MPKRRWLIATLVLAGVAAAEEVPRAKDDREYALVQQAIAEQDPAKRLGTLEAWSEEYEDSGLRTMRAQLYLQTYREAGKTAEAIGAAERLLELIPGDFAAHYTLASLAPPLGSIEEPDLARAERAAQALLDGGIAAQFDAERRPASVSVEAWQRAERESSAVSLRTLGWVAMQRSEHVEAEERLREALQAEPAAAQTSYWLAQSALAQRDPAKNELAFFSLARAATLEGKGELPAESREQIHAYLRKTYKAYSGTLDGLEDFERLAAASALPPQQTPRVLSAQERKAKAREEHCRKQPLECVYLDLRAVLEGASGEAVWSDLRGKLSPKMRLYVVGNMPADRPLSLRLASKPAGKAEVALELTNRLREPIPAGRPVVFEGIARALKREPFLLTLEQGQLLD